MKKVKLWKQIPQVPLIEKHLREFYEFIAERQAIWHRRFVLKIPPPWTSNRWLRDYKFTNVYRELDRGTLWLAKNILVDQESFTDPAETEKGMLWKIVAYRLLNRVETFEKVGLVPYNDWPEEGKNWIRKLQKLHKKESVFTSAHLTLPTHTIGKSKLKTYQEVLDDFFKILPDIYNDIKEAKDLGEVWTTLKNIKCVGPFIAYEVAVDLTYAKIVPFSEDSWVNPGPGCMFGIRLIFPLCKTREDFVRRIEYLRDSQSYHFTVYGIQMHYLDGKKLTLRNIEHSLCEYGKYWKLEHACGKSRIKFQPKTEGFTAQGQFPLAI